MSDQFKIRRLNKALLRSQSNNEDNRQKRLRKRARSLARKARLMQKQAQSLRKGKK